jgi:transposase
MNRRYELTNEQWERLEPLLPSRRGGRGRPGLDDRTVINGVLWVLCSGSPWRDIPERYGKWTSIYSRFQRWRKSGLWQQLLEKVIEQADAAGKVNWHAHYLDATIVKAHQHAAGAKKVTLLTKR